MGIKNMLLWQRSILRPTSDYF